MLSATAVRRKPVPFPGQAGCCVKNKFSPVAVICNGGYRVRTGRGCAAWRLSAAGFCMCGSPVFCVLLHRCLITSLFGGFFGIGPVVSPSPSGVFRFRPYALHRVSPGCLRSAVRGAGDFFAPALAFSPFSGETGLKEGIFPRFVKRSY